MIKQFAIIGMSSFSRRILEEIEDFPCEILLIDKDPEMIEFYKDKVARAYVADVLNEETIHKLIPPDIDGVILDPGDRIEVSILVTNYLKKQGVRNIFVRADTDEHGEILDLVGADHVIYPNREAAKRIAPLLLTSQLFNYMPISNGLVMAEVRAPDELEGKNLIEANLRRVRRINVVAVRREDDPEGFAFLPPDYRIRKDDIFLLAGQEEDIRSFAAAAPIEGSGGLAKLFRKIFRG